MIHYTTTVKKECLACKYTLEHQKMDEDADVANERKKAIMSAMDFCPYCSQVMPVRSYHFNVYTPYVNREEDI